VKVDIKTGSVISLYDKELGKELSSGNSLGQILYAYGGEGTTLLGNRPELSRIGADVKPCFISKEAKLKTTVTGTSIMLKGPAEQGDLKVTFTLPKHEKSLSMEYIYEKKEVDQLEAVYVDFPFSLDKNSAILSDSQIGWVDWHKDILPGACKEWLPLQTSILMRGDRCDIQIASPDAFLFTVGTPVEGKWTSDLETRGNRVYSYLLNNYWRVNYKGNQEGPICFRYSITSASSIPYEQAYQFGWIKRQGLIAQRMSYQEFRSEDIPEIYQGKAEGSLFDFASKHIVVSTIRGAKDGSGVIVRLQETGGYAGKIKLDFGLCNPVEIMITDHQERIIKRLHNCSEGDIEITLKPWEVSTYKCIFNSLL
jgi:hypothetical protein